MKINQRNNDLTYEVIRAAVNGDYDAEDIIRTIHNQIVKDTVYRQA